VLQNARPGDLVYLDPPYVPVSRTASFVGYARDGFDETDQERLAAMVEKLRARGVRVLLSNSDTPWVRQRYSAFDIHRVPARRNINCNSERRGPIGEVLVVV
jgi:DNA adenine methylase